MDSKVTQGFGNAWHGPVRVDVDFLNPIVDSIKKTSRDVWRQLPPEVQRGLPYVAVAFTSGLIVYKVQHRKYHLEVRRVPTPDNGHSTIMTVKLFQRST